MCVGIKGGFISPQNIFLKEVLYNQSINQYITNNKTVVFQL